MPIIPELQTRESYRCEASLNYVPLAAQQVLNQPGLHSSILSQENERKEEGREGGGKGWREENPFIKTSYSSKLF